MICGWAWKTSLKSDRIFGEELELIAWWLALSARMLDVLITSKLTPFLMVFEVWFCTHRPVNIRGFFKKNASIFLKLVVWKLVANNLCSTKQVLSIFGVYSILYCVQHCQDNGAKNPTSNINLGSFLGWTFLSELNPPKKGSHHPQPWVRLRSRPWKSPQEEPQAAI